MKRQVALNEFHGKEFSCDQEKLVCLAMDCFRMAMNMRTRNFTPETCLELLKLRLAHDRQRVALTEQQ